MDGISTRSRPTVELNIVAKNIARFVSRLKIFTGCLDSLRRGLHATPSLGSSRDGDTQKTGAAPEPQRSLIIGENKRFAQRLACHKIMTRCRAKFI
jgi:hypothetical protein